MKYTMSKDGVLRINLVATIRVEKEERARLSQRAKKQGMTLTKYLNDCLLCGVRWDDNHEQEDDTNDD